MVDTTTPAVPVGLGQGERRIIAVICHWEIPEPERTRDVEVQLLYGDMLLYYETYAPTRTERTFPVPMASTRYLLRVRAGNAAGWSAWAQAWVETQIYPLIDSRLGVLGASYQEPALYPDTWAGEMSTATDDGAEIASCALTLNLRGAGAVDARVTQGVRPTLAVDAFRAWNPVRRFVLREPPLRLIPDYLSQSFTASNLKRDVDAGGEVEPLAGAVALTSFNSAVVRFQTKDVDNPASLGATVAIADFTSEAQ